MTLFTPPAIPIFPDGYGPVPANFNTWVQNSLGFQTTGIMFRAERHASQTLTASANTVIAYDTISEDPYSGWQSGSSEWLAPYTGWYEVTVTSTAVAGSVIIAAVISTPETTYRSTEVLATTSLTGGCSACQIVPLIGGSDWVKGETFASGASTTPTTNGLFSTMEISFISQ